MMAEIIQTFKKTENLQILSKCHIVLNDKYYPVNAIWDTGTAKTTISTFVVEKLNLTEIGKKKLGGIDTIVDASIHKIDFAISDSIIFKDIEIVSSNFQSQYIDVLIGMDIITQGDFHITHLVNGEIRFDFVYPSETKPS